MNTKVQLISNEKCWMEHTALTQLENVAKLPDVVRAVGLPDLHAGQSPVGIAVETRGRVYPHLVGNDIGCGMGLYETGCRLAKFKRDKAVTRLNNIRALEDLPGMNPTGEDSPITDLGTLGGGNHFAEFQCVHEIVDEDAFEQLSIDAKQLLLLVHTGSRGYGQRILKEYLNYEGLCFPGEEAERYLALQQDALYWASVNRRVVADKLVAWLGYSTGVEPRLDCCHNFVQAEGGGFIHRKGAVSSLCGPVIIPGSRGSLTYIVLPEPGKSEACYSLSHGAGRKWARSLCKGRIRDKYDRDSIRQTKLGSRTVCHDTDLLFQEAPEAYKNIEQVIAALTDHGLCRVVATLRPLITYKG